MADRILKTAAQGRRDRDVLIELRTLALQREHYLDSRRVCGVAPNGMGQVAQSAR
jgi:hypothetical protein